MYKPYKISILDDKNRWIVKAVSLKESDAKMIVDELLTCGFFARYSSHIKKISPYD